MQGCGGLATSLMPTSLWRPISGQESGLATPRPVLTPLLLLLAFLFQKEHWNVVSNGDDVMWGHLLLF